MNFQKSQEHLKRALDVIPLATQTFSKGYNYFPQPVSPVFLDSGKGGCVRDVDDNWYIDYIMALGCLPLGYSHPRVNRAISVQMSRGISFSLPTLLEAYLAERLKDVIPCAEMSRFFKTGSEACQAAVRVARAYTGRDSVLHWGYHGWHDWYSVRSERPKGVPPGLRNYIWQFEYNNLKSLEMLFDACSGLVASVIMEPVGVQIPSPGFLEGVKELCHKNNALLIFDETITGFRFLGLSAQKYLGVTPDLACFGKSMGNGMPISAVVGRKDIMREFEDVFCSGTFGGEALSLAAAIKTIDILRKEPVLEHIWDLGKLLIKGLKSIGLDSIGYPCRPMIVLKNDTPELRSLILQELISKGVLIHNSMVLNFCSEHSKHDIDHLVNSLAATLLDIETGEARLKGSVVQPAFKRI